MSSKVFLPLVILTLYLASPTLGFGDIIIHVTSAVPNPPSPLRFRCQSKDNDLGLKTLVEGQEFSWRFQLHVPSVTVYSCHFYWGSKQREFVVYDSSVTRPLNDYNVYWVAKPDGFYQSNDIGLVNEYKKFFDWN
ncbi:S-protein homolog 29-like [Actinidia eriantha]|uniref:S-protein homolog 29-like n=1 Tax=Actinidia eriantha TaxID=165200 RepID=UPI002583A041|nr:S-protein homolog 29-like [Actinidia eriantha]